MGTRRLVRAALIAAVYILLVYIFAGVSFGIFQFRPAEALTLLPILYPEAVPALFVAVMLSNILGGLGPWDIFGGSLVTLLAAWITYRYRRSWIAYASPIVCNALLISIYLHLIFEVPYWLAAVGIGVSEAFSVLVIGIPLLKLIERRDSSR
ncbi:MAG TPA: QueT transporter family protein [Firmicutes bacterium]|nr:QueT transporter family protein [Bacillota bacterium]